MDKIDSFFQSLGFKNWEIYYDYFWESFTIESFLKLMVIYFFVIWISLIIWVYKDVTTRTQSIFLQTISILFVTLLTPLGFFLYLLIRPSRSIYESFYEEVEENLESLYDSVKNGITDCTYCGNSVSINYAFCPHCEKKLKQDCSHCHKKYASGYKVCPYCGKKNKKKENQKKS